MTGIPAIVVTLDDGTGTYPIDISQYVRLVDGISWSRGRPDQYQAIGPGNLSITVDNTAGYFTLPGSGFGTDPFGSGPFGGSIPLALSQGIRLKVAGQVRWTGRIESTIVQWPSGGQEFSTIAITAIDDLAKAGRKTLRSSAGEEILVDAPGGYYPLDEAAPDSAFASLPTASDVTGNPQMPPLTVNGISATPPAFGSTLPLPDGATGVKMQGTGFGTYLTNVNATTSWTSTNSIHFDVAFLGSVASIAGIVALNAGGAPAILQINAVGTISFPLAGITYAGALSPFVPHILSINGDNTFTDLWVDGVKVVTGAGITATWDNRICMLGDPFTGLSAGSMTLGHFNFGPKLSDARVLAHQNALLLDFRGETPAARITRVAGYAGMPVGTLDTSAHVLMGPSQQAGRTAADILDDVTQASQGIVYVDANGKLANVTGSTLLASVFPDSINDANWVSTDTSVTTDKAELVNYLIGNASGSSNVTTAINQASINQHGVYPPGGKQITWNVSSDEMARDLTNWQINTYAQPVARTPTVKYDAFSMDLANVLNALRLELGSFASVTGMPSQLPDPNLFLIVEGVSENISTTEWSITINGVRHAQSVAWFLGDSFFGKLNASTKLSY